MSTKIQLQKLKRVLSFYQTQADAIAVKVRKLNSDVANIQQFDNLLNHKIKLTHQTSRENTINTLNLQMTHKLLDQLAVQQHDNQQQLIFTQQTLAERRRQQTALNSKIESMEKLIAKKTENQATERRKREQRLADERYLNTNFSGTPQ